jgi:hypothetical protein
VALPEAPEQPEEVPSSCPNGSVVIHEGCVEADEVGFEGVLDGAPLHLGASVEATAPGTISMSRRGCGGPLTFAITFALDGERAGDLLTVYANATDDCLIQGVYLRQGRDSEAVGLVLTLEVWEDARSSVIRGTVVVTGSPGGAAPALLEGTFTLATLLGICLS